MSHNNHYGFLVDAERHTEIPRVDTVRSWQRLQGSLRAGRRPLPISALPLSFGAVLFTTKAAAMAIVVSATAAGAGWLYRAELGLTQLETPPAGAIAPRRGLPSPHARVRAPAPSIQSVSPAPSSQAAQSGDSFVSQPLAGTVRLRQPSPTAAAGASPPSELQLIGEARSEVDRGSPSGARRWLQEHAKWYPRGALKPEREALTVIVDCSENRGQSAQAAAQAYVRRQPGSIYQDRVKRACQLAPSESTLRPAETVETRPETGAEASFPLIHEGK